MISYRRALVAAVLVACANLTCAGAADAGGPVTDDTFSQGATKLMLKAQAGDLGAVQVFLAAKADVNVQTGNSGTALMAASMRRIARMSVSMVRSRRLVSA